MMKRQDTTEFGFHFYDRYTPHGKFDFKKKAFTLDQNRTLFQCLEKEVLFKFPDPIPEEIVALKELLDTYDHREWSAKDWSDTNMGVSCSSDHGSIGTRIRFESLEHHDELIKRLMAAIERIARPSSLFKAEYTWTEVFKVMKDGSEDEIKSLRCPACGGELSFVYDEHNLELHCCGNCGATLVFKARGWIPHCVRYFGNETNIKTRRSSKEAQKRWSGRKVSKGWSVEMRGSKAKRVPLDEGGFARGTLPKDRIEQMAINHSQIDWWVTADEGGVAAVNILEGRFMPTLAMVHPMKDSYLFADDHGEFGGGLSVYKHGVSQGIGRCNPQGFFDFDGRTFMIEGLDHLCGRRGALYEIREGENRWDFVLIADFGTAPFCHCPVDGAVYILTGDNLWRFDGRTAERVPGIDFEIGSYYPNNMLVHDGSLFIGMRHGVLQISLSNMSLTWWNPRQHVIDSVGVKEEEDEYLWRHFIPFDLH